MPIIVSEPVNERGRKDARRHRDKQREAIKKHLPEIIADESIITHKKGKVVKIPIRSIDIPHFKPETGGDESGLGQGPGESGDIIGQKQLPEGGSEPGEDPGEDLIETEVPIEELIEMMLEDLGLPRLEDRDIQNIVVELGWKITGLGSAGIWPLIDRKATAREGVRRFWYFLRALEAETGQSELACYRALKQTKGVIADALELISTNRVEDKSEQIEPFPILVNDDLRFRQIEKDTQEQSQAVIIAMMDVSGSMGTTKKYLARAMLFWLVEFLRKLYQQVEIRFITHHAVAKIVPEDDFFRTMESGGTQCYTAYEKAADLIESEYPTKSWNVYVWHFSDGEDFNPPKTVEALKNLIAKDVNMVGYGEIDPDGERDLGSSSYSLWNTFKSELEVRETVINDMDAITGPESFPFLGVRIESGEDILPALKTFLKKDRWTK